MKGICIRTGFMISIMAALYFGSARRMYARVDDRPILIISSYNPDSYSTSTNISAFIEEYNRLGGASRVHIENMNCRSFSESLQWKGRMSGILNKYRKQTRPGCIILLGQEAWASYLSQDDSITSSIPVFSAMASRNAVILPDGGVSLRDWMPESVDFIEGQPAAHIQGGFLYEYDVESNIRLIRKLYPATRNIAFVSDNTYGGVSLQAFVRRKLQGMPELNLILLDGRTHTIYTIVEALRELPENTALLLGTWRVDRNDGYFMQNATYSMMEAAPDVPVFTLTSLGLGYWAIGGYMPVYREFGRDLARQVAEMQKDGTATGRPVRISNQLKVDSKKIAALGIGRRAFPDETVYTNVEPTFYDEYRWQIWVVALVVAGLTGVLVVVTALLGRTRRMKNSLLLSEADLRVAKERAEQANRMKNTFLANMSHEIRTPLNAIVGFSGILATGDPSPNVRQKCAENIKSSSSLLLRLINDILDLSRLEAEKMAFTWEEHDIVLIMRRAISIMEQAATNGNRYVFRPVRHSLMLFTDEQRIQQVFINLLTNAAKFTKSGTITADFSIDDAEGMVEFSVTDTGCGIPPEMSEVIFERFEKLDSFVQGTGLGLSICRQIVSKWGGTIRLDTNYSAGARFVFTHPLKIRTGDGSTQ